MFAPPYTDNVMYAVTRPSHVQIADILVYATYQCSAKGIARPKLGQPHQQPQQPPRAGVR